MRRRDCASGTPRRLAVLCAALIAAQLFSVAPDAAGEDQVKTEVATQPSKPEHGSRTAAAVASLTGNSSLAEWRAATPAARSQVAVAIARSHLALDATKLEIATAAMEITGCVSSTAKDQKFDNWKVAPTALTCLNAPEKPAK